ncbi:type II/IV secretion system protein [Candidatus Woesebacteria bacterium]|nr:type II/IV secretion system protein [Candidatus Woesebacteria bacterium]
MSAQDQSPLAPPGGGVAIPPQTAVSITADLSDQAAEFPNEHVATLSSDTLATSNLSTTNAAPDIATPDAVAAATSLLEQASELDTPTPAPTVPTAPSPPTATATTPTPPPAAPQSSSSDQTISLETLSEKSYGSITDVLIAMELLDQGQVSTLLVDTVSAGKPVEKLIEEQKLVSEEELTQARSVFYHIPFVKLGDTGIFPEALSQIPEGVARNYSMLPFAYDKNERTLSVAMRNPLDLAAIDFAEQKSNLKLKAYYATPSELDRMIAEYYSQTLSSEVTAALEQTTQMAEVKKKRQDLSELSGETIRQAPITKIVQTILAFAIKARASDVHIEPLEDRTRVRYRIDGILTEKLILPLSVHEAVVSRVKILSGLKIDEKRLPQDGRFNFATAEQEIDLRVSTLPTINGEKIVMRLLKKDQAVPTLPELGLTGIALRNVQEAIKVPHGIVLVTGPTGSGKTTTLYSILHRINTPKVNIMTLEDPVEYQMPGVNQVQINVQAGLTFASGLRSFLRQDPNVIMVGEIRDSETAELAVQASLTGHLVFATLHTSSAAGAIPRLMDMGAEPFLLASSMTLVMAQRVLRKINDAYKEEYRPEPSVIADIQAVLGDRFLHWCQQKGKKPEEITLFRPKQVGRPDTEPEYKGRVAIFEVMKVSDAIGKMILERKPSQDMEKLAIQEGMFLMKQDGYMKALDGVTTLEEVLRVAQI